MRMCYSYPHPPSLFCSMVTHVTTLRTITPCPSIIPSLRTPFAVTLPELHLADTNSTHSVALIIQIHLGQNRTDLAVSAAKSARSFAQDALLVNLAESWIGLRQGGDKYQQAFYVFEELAQSPSSSSTSSLIAQAVSELHLGRLQEAEAALQQAIEAESENTDALANLLVLNTILGREKEAQDAKEKLQSKGHALMDDLAAKREAFEAACAKYNPKFEP